MSANLFKVKVCGVTSAADAVAAQQAGADAIGVNFHEPSVRFQTLDAATRICEAVASAVKVAVCVNKSVAELYKIWESLPLEFLQLHGDEPAEMIGDLPAGSVIRAVRCADGGLPLVERNLAQCLEAGRLPAAVLIDAYQPGSYGGTGQTVDWPSVGRWRDDCPVPLILAGGLTAENVAEAIRLARPDAVDTASGVESEPGKKDATMMRDFSKAALEAFRQL